VERVSLPQRVDGQAINIGARLQSKPLSRLPLATLGYDIPKGEKPKPSSTETATWKFNPPINPEKKPSPYHLL